MRWVAVILCRICSGRINDKVSRFYMSWSSCRLVILSDFSLDVSGSVIIVRSDVGGN